MDQHNIDDARLYHVEQTLVELQLGQARLEEQVKAHAEASRLWQDTVGKQIATLVAQIEPLREQQWKQRGASTVLGMVGGTIAMLVTRFLMGIGK